MHSSYKVIIFMPRKHSDEVSTNRGKKELMFNFQEEVCKVFGQDQDIFY